MSDVTPIPEAPSPQEAEPVDLAAYQALRAQEEAGSEEEPEGLFVLVREQKFHVTTELPAIVILDLGVASDPSASTGAKLMALRGFLSAAIVPEEIDAFNHLLRSAKPAILMEELNEITEDLMSKVVAVPTE